MASLGSSLKAMVSLVRVLTKICVCVPCRRRLFGSPEDVVVLETHVLCAYSVSLLSDLYSPFSLFASRGSSPAPSFSLSLSFVRARALPCGCGPPRLIPSRALTWLVSFPTSFSCVACVVELGADADPLCSRAEVVGVEDVVVYPFFSLLFPSPLFPLPYISPAFLSFPVSAIVLACHML